LVDIELYALRDPQ